MTNASPRPRGFTLVEVVIVMAIVAILAAIAIPSYRNYVLRSNRATAKAALSELAQRQENYSVDHKTYASSTRFLGLGDSDTLYVTRDGVISTADSNSAYSLTAARGVSVVGTSLLSCAGTGALNGSGGTAYVIIATPKLVDPGCDRLCVSSTGEHGASGTLGAAECWRR